MNSEQTDGRTDGMEWSGMGWNGMEWDGMGWNGVRRVICKELTGRRLEAREFQQSNISLE